VLVGRDFTRAALALLCVVGGGVMFFDLTLAVETGDGTA